MELTYMCITYRACLVEWKNRGIERGRCIYGKKVNFEYVWWERKVQGMKIGKTIIFLPWKKNKSFHWNDKRRENVRDAH